MSDYCYQIKREKKGKVVMVFETVERGKVGSNKV